MSSDLTPAQQCPSRGSSLHMRSLRLAFEPLWVSGLLLSLLLASSGVLPCHGERLEWILYLVTGAVFPALLLLLFAAPFCRRAFFCLRTALATAFVVLALGVCAGSLSAPFLVIAAAQGVLTTAVLVIRRRRRGHSALAFGSHEVPAPVNQESDARVGIAWSAVAAVPVTVLSWIVASRLVWWTPFLTWSSSSRYTLLVLVASLVLVVAALYSEEPKGGLTSRSQCLIELGGNGLALLILAALSFRTDSLLAYMKASMHHWGAIVGPAELVRQGGWLLWDVPSQYGFLSTLALAGAPFPTVHQSLYVVSSTLQFLAAGLLFVVLRSLGRGVVNLCFALLLAGSAVFLVPGAMDTLLGPYCWPAVGAFRFIWVYVLLGVILCSQRRDEAAGPPPAVLRAGCIAWLLGVLWSFESAIYSSCVWLPAYLWLLIGPGEPSQPGWGGFWERVRTRKYWLALPFVLLAATLGMVSLYYRVQLGHLPDWWAFAEHAVSFRAGFFALPIQRDGAVWVLVLSLCGLATTAVLALTRKSGSRSVPLLVGAGAALWATSSYFVGRSHEINVCNLAPIFTTVIAVTLLCGRRCLPEGSMALVKASFVPVLSVLLTVSYGQPRSVTHFAANFECNPGYADRLIPPLDPSLQRLYESTGVRPTDPTVHCGRDFGPAPPGVSPDSGMLPRAWLPIMPFTVYTPLTSARSKVYLERFTSRRPSSGWLLQHKQADFQPITARESTWFNEQLRTTHRATRSFENARWRLTWYEFRSGPAVGYGPNSIQRNAY
jgi:hypothetical protein